MMDWKVKVHNLIGFHNAAETQRMRPRQLTAHAESVQEIREMK
jgi:hypothetical protein